MYILHTSQVLKFNALKNISISYFFPSIFFQVLVITHYVKLITMIYHVKHFPRGLGFYTNTLVNVAEVIKFTLNHSNMEDVPLIPRKYKSYKL